MNRAIHPSSFRLYPWHSNGVERARTANPRVANAVLSQLSYDPGIKVREYTQGAVRGN